MPAGQYKKLLGTILSFFQFGDSTGPGINANGTALETKNAANSAFAIHRGALPVGDNDFATKKYVDTTANKPIPVSLQFNGNNALPANSGTEQWYLVTTTGPNATIGQILWDDGSGVGTVTVIPAATGNTVITTTAFTGGTITFAGNQLLIWSGTAWIDVIPSVAGAVYRIRFALTNAASQSSATSIPANYVISNVLLDITTAYSAGATISVGQTGSTALLMATTDNVPQSAAQFSSEQDTAWGAAALPVLVTVAGAPAAGAGFCVVDYCLPNP